MKYILKEVTEHCLDKPALWSEITSGAQFSPCMHFITTPIRIKGLKDLDAWPWWAKALKLVSTKRDIGLGSTLARWSRWTGLTMAKNLLKINCHCMERGAVLDRRFPLH